MAENLTNLKKTGGSGGTVEPLILCVSTSNNLSSNDIRYYHVDISVNDSGILYNYDYSLYYTTRWSSGTINTGLLTYGGTSFYVTFDIVNIDGSDMCRIQNFKVYDKNGIQIPHTHIDANIMWYANSSGTVNNYDNIAGY